MCTNKPTHVTVAGMYAPLPLRGLPPLGVHADGVTPCRLNRGLAEENVFVSGADRSELNDVVERKTRRPRGVLVTSDK